MLKLKITCVLAALMAAALPGCAKDGGDTKEVTASSEFTGTLTMVPFSLFEKYDVYYANPGLVKELNGITGVNSLEDYYQLTAEKRAQFDEGWRETSSVFPSWHNKADQIETLAGFSTFAFDRVVLIDSAPPHLTYIAFGNFNEGLIAGKLAEQGYTEMTYGEHTYYAKGDDFQIDIINPLGRIVKAGMNRVAVLDGILILSPTTEDVTAILDTIDGKSPSVMGNAEYKALAESLGNPLAAALTAPERIITTEEIQENSSAMKFTMPDGWGQLHGYGTAALGYRADGETRYFDIALYYTDKAAAEADGQEIIKRMGNYSSSLALSGDNVPFSDVFQPGEPVVQTITGGAVLKISCEINTEQQTGIMLQLGGNGFTMRDLIFLAVNPEEYETD
ncbi:MAG: hypothetical protein WC370_08665 [Dehalococcoidales bacterium]|jgi:hypothetical protein